MRLAPVVHLAALISAALGGQAVAQGAGPLAQSTSAVAMQASMVGLVNPFRQSLALAAGTDEAVSAFYRDRDYAPIWTGAGDAARRAAFLSALAQAPLHALPGRRFDPTPLVSALQTATTEADRGRLEAQMTRLYLDYARAIGTGIVDPFGLAPKEVDYGFVRKVQRREASELLAGISGADPAAFLRSLPPASDEYARLLRARAQLVAAAASGGWGPKVQGRALKVGDSGPAVIALRDRLVRLGYLGRSVTAQYDAAMQAAVQAFQIDHGLVTDGTAGDGTIAEINKEPQDRLKSVTVALERERWLPRDRGQRHIWVNLVDFTAKILDDGKVSFSTKSVVGQAVHDKKTPEFSHLMTYMEINPDWTVPPGLIRRDYLPALQANPYANAYLDVVDGAGRVIPRDAIDFNAYNERTFPFNLRQRPGPRNALGLVKFMFPNEHAIYLHDTPDKHLFSRDSRAYSSGCIRLGDPFDFAYALLAKQSSDPEGLFQSYLKTGKKDRIYLEVPVPVHLDYRTAFTGATGEVHYRRDVYGRDALIYRALAEAGVDPARLSY